MSMEENILPDEELSPEDLAARKKGLALVARIEQLMQTDEGFRDWFQEGIDQIEAGQFVIFDENGWHEEPEIIHADTDRASSPEELAKALDIISHLTEVKDTPLPFDPDDYPVV